MDLPETISRSSSSGALETIEEEIEDIEEMYQELFEAIRKGDLAGARPGIQRGLAPCQTAIDYAVGMGYLDIIKYLMEWRFLPSRLGATAAQLLGRKEMLTFLAEHSIRPKPTSDGVLYSVKQDSKGQKHENLEFIY